MSETAPTGGLEPAGEPCENCGAPNAGAIVGGTIYCGSCASNELGRSQ